MADDKRVVVIGSGPAGAMAAHELVSHGIPVTMLDSGQSLQSGMLIRVMGANVLRSVPRLTNNKHYTATGDPDTRWYSHLAPGGLSNQWSGAVPRFAPEDFQDGKRLDPRYSWPIGYEDLAPYYDKVERLMQVTADVRDVPGLPAGKPTFLRTLPADWQAIGRRAVARGQGLTTMPLAHGPRWMFVRRGTAFNSFTSLIRPLITRPGFQLLTGLHCLRLEWSGRKRKVTAALCRNRADGTEQRIEAAAFVVACGAIGSPKLLFNSACNDFPDGLGNTEGVLGRYLHDHPRERWVFDTDKPISLLNPPAYLTRLPIASSVPLIAASWTLGAGSVSDRIKGVFAKVRTVGVQVFGTMVPSVDNYIKPSFDGKDEFGMQRPQIKISYDDATLANMRDARQSLFSLMADAGYNCHLKRVDMHPIPGDSIHYAGSVRMHEDPAYGVLNAWNRVHEIDNLVVCDASCFTTGSEKNPTLTAMAIATRSASRLAYDLQTS
jgi:choline dehydrogenase-like flavoprotein